MSIFLSWKGVFEKEKEEEVQFKLKDYRQRDNELSDKISIV